MRNYYNCARQIIEVETVKSSFDKVQIGAAALLLRAQ
jgi:hypothetical protein